MYPIFIIHASTRGRASERGSEGVREGNMIPTVGHECEDSERRIDAKAIERVRANFCCDDTDDDRWHCFHSRILCATS